ncbi:MAG: PilZ domain-containing protein [Candidatus Omnitrophota bacterium]|nr:MAG: PilZ domain-containing protein [Candidatus Omnitrophota bacterium]
MNNRRRLIRVEVKDFLQIQPLNEVGKRIQGKARDFSLMGICFASEMEWQKGQVLFIDYFIPEELDSVKLKIVVVWSEFIDPAVGYFCGGEIIDVEEEKQATFAHYYFQKLRERFY